MENKNALYFHLGLLGYPLSGLSRLSLRAVRKPKLAHVERPPREAMCRLTAQLRSQPTAGGNHQMGEWGFLQMVPAPGSQAMPGLPVFPWRHQTFWNRDKLASLCHAQTAACRICQDKLMVVLCQYGFPPPPWRDERWGGGGYTAIENQNAPHTLTWEFNHAGRKGDSGMEM